MERAQPQVLRYSCSSDFNVWLINYCHISDFTIFPIIINRNPHYNFTLLEQVLKFDIEANFWFPWLLLGMRHHMETSVWFQFTFGYSRLTLGDMTMIIDTVCVDIADIPSTDIYGN